MVEKILQLAAHITCKNHIPRAPNCSVPPISLSILQSPRPQIHSVAIAAHRVHRSRSVVHRRWRIKLVCFFYFPRKHLFISVFSLSQPTLESHLWRSTTLAPASYPSPYYEQLILNLSFPWCVQIKCLWFGSNFWRPSSMIWFQPMEFLSEFDSILCRSSWLWIWKPKFWTMQVSPKSTFLLN